MSHAPLPADVAAAEAIAAAAHAGQTDKAGHDYIDHPRRVARAVRHRGPSVAAVAWLHDVVEDTPVTLGDLADQFPPAVVDAVDALTKRPGEPLDAYYARVRSNPIALPVKLADIADNSDPRRLDSLPPATAQRLRRKYAHAVTALQRPTDRTREP